MGPRRRDSAERAYESMSGRGYSKDDVNLLMSDETRRRHFPPQEHRDSDLGSKALEGAGAGAAIGGAVGGVLAAIAVVASVAIPGGDCSSPDRSRPHWRGPARVARRADSSAR